MAIQSSIRYRGYVYDTETGLYYLQSRYYDPETGRFLNADVVDFIGASGTVLGYNAFAYCENNSVNDNDPLGYISIKTIIAYFKSLGEKAWSIVKSLISKFVWKKGYIGLKMLEIAIDVSVNFLPFAKAFKFVTYKAVTKAFVQAAFKKAKKSISVFLQKMAFKISFNTLFAKIVNSIFVHTSRLLTVGGIICLVIDNSDGEVDYWFNYGKFKS